MKPQFFSTPEELRKWFVKNHSNLTELLVGYYKVGSGKPSITWPESVDQALCFGWIDGIRRSLDDQSYTIRFTPRRKGSIWSTVNIRRANELIKEKLMQPAGLAAFEARKEYRSGIYSYEQRSAGLPDQYASEFKKHKAAWQYFEAQPPYYRKALVWFVLSAKREETRLQRLEKLIQHSKNKEWLPGFRRDKK